MSRLICLHSASLFFLVYYKKTLYFLAGRFFFLFETWKAPLFPLSACQICPRHRQEAECASSSSLGSLSGIPRTSSRTWSPCATSPASPPGGSWGGGSRSCPSPPPPPWSISWLQATPAMSLPSPFCAKQMPKRANYLVTVDVQPQRVRLTAVIEQKQSWENRSSDFPGKEKLNYPKIEKEKN